MIMTIAMATWPLAAVALAIMIMAIALAIVAVTAMMATVECGHVPSVAVVLGAVPFTELVAINEDGGGPPDLAGKPLSSR